MKNLSVSKKILCSFVAVILMIAVLLTVTLVTSQIRNKDLDQIVHMNEFQNKADNLLISFNKARIEIRTLFTAIDTQEEYLLVLEYLAECETILEEMAIISTAMEGYLSEEIGTLDRMFEDIYADVEAVGTNDLNATARIADMEADGALMNESTLELFDLVVGLTTQVNDMDAMQTHIGTITLPVTQMSHAIDQVQIQSRPLMLNQDTSAIPELNAMLDSIERQAAGIMTYLTTDASRAAMNRMTGALADYRQSIVEVQEILAQSDLQIEVARGRFIQLMDLVENAVHQSDNEVSTLIGKIAASSRRTTIIMIAVSALAVVFSFFVAGFLGRIITGPLNKMKNVMTQVGTTGNFAFSQQTMSDILTAARSKDEIGQSLQAFVAFIDYLQKTAQGLQRVADKDLTVEVQLLSEQDTMGGSLKTMLDSLNAIFAEINSAATQVSFAAKEIAIVSQGLAQGSSEQAATAQEISASMTQIGQQMNQSSTIIHEAAQNSLDIKKAAQEGDAKMESLSAAMHEINEASQAIGKVIKVIDDIAFQTDILALNAAVEAARAGEHGKGFSVVAEEVRNLASKSAKAAKETAQLISTNIEKTELGLSYVESTSETLKSVTQSINQNSESLQEIVRQNANAQTATEEVNTAVEQVSQVVVQNSATSQQSASSSQHLSAQANILQQMVAQFKLRGGDAPQQPQALPPQPAGQEEFAIGGKY